METNSGVRLQACFEVDNKKDILWYEVKKKYEEYLAVERADAFVVGLFLLAFEKGTDIQVLGPLSERLYYNLNTYLLPITADVRNYNPIKIHCDQIESTSLKNSGAVGTGLSCGIDSFSTICSHMDDCPNNYQITHFTFFNVGSNGSLGGEKANALFKKRVAMVKPCADELGKELITVDSNISEILQLNFYESHSYRNASACLALQKLFHVYYYSSNYSLKYFELKPNSCGHYDTFNMNMLSNETINLYSTCPYHTRVEKTKMVANYKPATKYLNVCTVDGENCGSCDKCVRTLITIEILGKLKEFESIFNMENYYKMRSRFLARVIANKKKDDYMKEIYDEIQDVRFKIPLYSSLASYYLMIRNLVWR